MADSDESAAGDAADADGDRDATNDADGSHDDGTQDAAADDDGDRTDDQNDEDLGIDEADGDAPGLAGPALAAVGAIVLFFAVAISVTLDVGTVGGAAVLLGAAGLVGGVLLERRG